MDEKLFQELVGKLQSTSKLTRQEVRYQLSLIKNKIAQLNAWEKSVIDPEMRKLREIGIKKAIENGAHYKDATDAYQLRKVEYVKLVEATKEAKLSQRRELLEERKALQKALCLPHAHPQTFKRENGKWKRIGG